MSESLYQLRRTLEEQSKYDEYEKYSRGVRDLVIISRQDQHGDFTETHKDIASVWNLVLRRKLHNDITASDVALCMAAMKLVRSCKPGYSSDNFDDLGAYAGIAKVLKLSENGDIPYQEIKEPNDT